MRPWLLAILLAACVTRPLQRISPPPGALARVEASADLDGKPVGTSDAQATIVVLLASWCEHCKAELAEIDSLRAAHPRLRILGVNYKGHEEYDHRGSPAAIRAYVTARPWLRIVPADDALFSALGSPPMVPTMFVFDRGGALSATFDRRARAMPDAAELSALLAPLGA